MLFIDKENMELYGARILSAYEYTPPEITAEYFKGRQRSDFITFSTSLGMAKLELTVTFYHERWREVTQNKAAFDGKCLGRTNIVLGDGYEYFAILTEIGESNYRSPRVLECSYSFEVIRHGPYMEKKGNTIFCESTLPYTDCVLSARVSQDGTNYQMGPVMFAEVYAGQVLTVDGIDKRILVGGAPDARGAEWVRFPSLEPGENHFSCLDELTIGYYPSYF